MRTMDNQIGLEPKTTPLEYIYIDDDSNSTVSKKFCRSRRSHEKRNRKVKVERNNNMETLVISQQVKVRKQKIQCIINLTNICEHEEAHLPCHKKHHKKVRSHKKSLKALEELKRSHTSLKNPQKPKKNSRWDLKTHTSVISHRESPKTTSKPNTSPVVDLKAQAAQISHKLSPRTQPGPKESPKVTLKAETDLFSPNISSKTLSTLKTSPKAYMKPNDALISPKVSTKIYSEPNTSPKVDLKVKIERIVPQCLRKRCQGAVCTRYGRETAKERRKKRKHSKHKKEDKIHAAKVLKTPERMYSPISLTSLQRSPSMQDISSDSLTVYSDDHLDTLIKRTRDWETKQGKSFEYNPIRASTPKTNVVSDAETMHIMSEGDNSIGTVILETQLDMDLDLYSPIHPMQNLELEALETNFLNYYEASSELSKYSPAILDIPTNKENIKTECNIETSDKYFKKDVDIKPLLNNASKCLNEHSENKQLPRIKHEQNVQFFQNNGSEYLNENSKIKQFQIKCEQNVPSFQNNASEYLNEHSENKQLPRIKDEQNVPSFQNNANKYLNESSENKQLLRIKDEQNVQSFQNHGSEYLDENYENKQLRIKDEQNVSNEIGVTENDLHIQRSPEIKEEKLSSPLLRHCSPKLYNFWSNDNNYNIKSDTKYSSFEDLKQVPYNVPNIKVENSIDFSTYCE